MPTRLKQRPTSTLQANNASLHSVELKLQASTQPHAAFDKAAPRCWRADSAIKVVNELRQPLWLTIATFVRILSAPGARGSWRARLGCTNLFGVCAVVSVAPLSSSCG